MLPCVDYVHICLFDLFGVHLSISIKPNFRSPLSFPPDPPSKEYNDKETNSATKTRIHKLLSNNGIFVFFLNERL